jgi:ABC-type dipeptide/oligopeptide/nickel transport system permease component
MRTWLYVVRRLLLVIPQMFLISVATFTLVRMLPGDPARLQLGPFASQEAVDNLRHKMRLDEPLPQQYIAYLKQLPRGDLGRSWVNASDVKDDLVRRVPATLELISFALLVVLFVLVPLGVVTSTPGGGLITRILKRFAFVYSAIAGALPDFWLALLLVFVFFTKLGIAPGPEGRLSILMTPPDRITGFYTIDALLTGNFEAFADAARHLPLPVITLAAVYGAVVYKMTRATMAIALRSDYTTYAKGFGLSKARVLWYAFRNAAPPIITMTGIISGYLLGAAVLVETVYNFNGIGQYAVQAIVTADYAPIQAFVLVAAVFTMLVYLVVDLIHFAADPRVRVHGK